MTSNMGECPRARSATSITRHRTARMDSESAGTEGGQSATELENPTAGLTELDAPAVGSRSRPAGSDPPVPRCSLAAAPGVPRRSRRGPAGPVAVPRAGPSLPHPRRQLTLHLPATPRGIAKQCCPLQKGAGSITKSVTNQVTNVGKACRALRAGRSSRCVCVRERDIEERERERERDKERDREIERERE